MSGYVLAPTAVRDLDEIEASLTERNPTAAADLVDAIEQACELLGEHPGVGRARDEIAPGVHGWPVGSYVIFYRPDPRPVGIARILHGHRDLPVAFHDD